MQARPVRANMGEIGANPFDGAAFLHIPPLQDVETLMCPASYFFCKFSTKIVVNHFTNHDIRGRIKTVKGDTYHTALAQIGQKGGQQ